MAVATAGRRLDREELRRKTGADEMPALSVEDGTAINDDTDEIIAYLDRRYSEREDAGRHRERAEAAEDS